MKLEKIIFSTDDNPEYSGFWKINSEICKKKLGITPVLFKIGETESDFYEDEFGIIKEVKAIEGLDTGFQAQIYRMYGTKYFTNEIVMTSDIDMLLLNRDYVNSQIDLISDCDLVIFNSDSYDNSRPECAGIYSGPDRYPICYVVGKGSTFNQIINTDVDFNEYCDRLLRLDLNWDTDEIYFGRCVNSQNKIKVHKLIRGYSSNFFCPNRIEKRDFYNSVIFSIDLEKKINLDSFIDCHCARPYSQYKVAIDNIKNTVLRESRKEVYLIGCHIENQTQKDLLYELVDFLESNDKLFIISSHTSIPEDILMKSVGFIYDSVNPKYKTWNLPNFPKFRFDSNNFTIDSPHIGYGSEDYYHVGVIRLLINGIKYIQSTDYDIVHWIEYDSIPDLEMNSNANYELQHNDFIFYGIGSRFSFLNKKVNSNFIKLTDSDILKELSKNSYLAERLISEMLIDGKKVTHFLDESKRELWGRYSQNFNNRKLNWSVFRNGNNVDLFLHNISDDSISIEIGIDGYINTISLPPHNWNLNTIGTNPGDFLIVCNGKEIIKTNLQQDTNIINQTVFLQK